MGSRRWTTAAIAATVASLLAGGGCGGAAPDAHRSGRSSTTPTATVSSTPTATPAPVSPVAIDVAGARPVRDIATVVGGVRSTAAGTFGEIGMSPDGTVVVTGTPAADAAHPLRLDGSRLYLTDRHGTSGPMTPVPLGPPRTQGTQISGVALDSRWLVWEETPSTDLKIQTWAMYAYDRQTHLTHLVTRSLKLADGTPSYTAPGWTGPKLHGDTVVWAEVTGGEPAPRVDIVACEVTRCARRTLLRGAAFPSVTPNAVYGITAPGYRGEVDANGQRDFRDVAIEEHSFDTGKSRVVRPIALGPDDETVAFFTADAGAFVWTTLRKGLEGRPTITIARGQDVVRIVGEKGGGFGYPVATPSMVIWAESSGGAKAQVGGYVYRYADKTTYRVGNKSGLYGVDAAGDYLSWQEADDPHQVNGPVTDVIARLK